jgi:hypothetical protein
MEYVASGSETSLHLDQLSSLEGNQAIQAISLAAESYHLPYLSGILLKLGNLLSEIPINSSNGITRPGNYIFELFAKIGITNDTKDEIATIIESTITLLITGTNGLRDFVKETTGFH